MVTVGERNAAKLRRQAAFLAALSQHEGVRVARELTDTPLSTLKMWKREPGFHHQMDVARGFVSTGTLDARGEPFPDFLSFRRSHFAYLDHRTKRVVRATNSFYQLDAEQKLSEHKRLLMVMPPGHVKTSLFAVERSVWQIMKDRNWRGAVVQKNQQEATKLVAAVQERLQCSFYHFMGSELERQGVEPITCPVCRFGGSEGFKAAKHDPGAKWGAYGFRVVGRTSGEKDDTFQALGAGSQIQGIRADAIVLDDVQDPLQAMKSLRDSDELLNWFHAVILGRVTDEQQVVVLANFMTPDDFAHKLIVAHPDWPLVTYPAIRACGQASCPGDAACKHKRSRVLCPEFWTWDALQAKRREVGEQVWYYTWMQEEGSFAEHTFKRERVEAARSEDHALGEVPHGVTDIFVGVDPAFAASGFCAIVVWGLDRNTKQRYLIDVFNKAGMATAANVVAQIEEMVRRYGPRTCVIETNNIQRALALSPEFIRAMRSAGCRVVTYQTVTGTGARAESTNFDITTIGGLFDAGLVTLPYSGPFEDRAKVDAYAEQLIHWRTDSDGNSIKHLVRDMVMATLFAESEAFVVANRPRVPYVAKPKKVPRFARNPWGGWRWDHTQRDDQRERTLDSHAI